MAASTPTASHAHFREHEVRLLVEMVRLSRVTLLIAERDSHKSAVLQSSVMPLLGEAKTGGKSEIAVFFDAWGVDPLPALRARLEAVVGESAGGAAQPSGDTLADCLKAWQEALGATFLFVFDRFEDYLRAPSGRRGYAEFVESFVQVATDPALRANFLLALDEDAELLLGHLRERIPRLGYSRVRLPRAAVAGAASPAAAPAPEAPLLETPPTVRPAETARERAAPAVSLSIEPIVPPDRTRSPGQPRRLDSAIVAAAAALQKQPAFKASAAEVPPHRRESEPASLDREAPSAPPAIPGAAAPPAPPDVAVPPARPVLNEAAMPPARLATPEAAVPLSKPEPAVSPAPARRLDGEPEPFDPDALARAQRASAGAPGAAPKRAVGHGEKTTAPSPRRAMDPAVTRQRVKVGDGRQSRNVFARYALAPIVLIPVAALFFWEPGTRKGETQPVAPTAKSTAPAPAVADGTAPGASAEAPSDSKQKPAQSPELSANKSALTRAPASAAPAREAPAPQPARTAEAVPPPKPVAPVPPPVATLPAPTAKPPSTAPPQPEPASRPAAAPTPPKPFASAATPAPAPTPPRAATAAAGPAPAQTIAVAPTTPPVAAEAPAGPVLYIHVRNEAQRAWAQQMVRPLGERGIKVAAIRIVSSGPDEPDIRYHRLAERREAMNVSVALRDFGLRAQHLKQMETAESAAPARQYELWLPATGFDK